MLGCGCGSSSSYSPNPGDGVDATSNSVGKASWNVSGTASLPRQGISGRSPYGPPPVRIGGISFCRKCFLTWTVVFVVLAVIFFRARK